MADLERAEAESGVKMDGHIVLLCIGLHERHWPHRTISTENPG